MYIVRAVPLSMNEWFKMIGIDSQLEIKTKNQKKYVKENNKIDFEICAQS